MRCADLNSRYSYAPDMLDAAKQSYVIYDPYEQMDAAHAAIFTRSNVKKLRMPNMGTVLLSKMITIEILKPLLIAASDNNLTNHKFTKLFHTRRGNRGYSHGLMQKVDAQGPDNLTRAICNHVMVFGRVSRFQRKLKALYAKLTTGD